MPGWRGLAVFWTVVLLAAAGGGAVLQSLGPPGAPPARIAAATTGTGLEPPPANPVKPAPTPPAAPVAAAAPVTPPGRATAGPIDDPDPALLEPAKAGAGAMLPRMDATGRGPMQAYARGFDQTTLRPRIGIILAGIGTSESDSQDAIRILPGAVTFAISPYTLRPARLLEAARIAGHEYLLSLPMETGADSTGDLGDHVLLTGAPPAQNAARLDWLLSRFNGYVGVTDAFGRLHGDRFASSNDLMVPLLRGLAARGLLYVDARPDAVQPPGVWGASVDLIIDEPAVRSEIDRKLGMLESLARQRGWALGLAGAPRPVTVDSIADWANGLAAKGLILAPVSALARQNPGKPPAAAPIAGASK